MRKENGAIPIRERSNAQVPFFSNTAPSHFSLSVQHHVYTAGKEHWCVL